MSRATAPGPAEEFGAALRFRIGADRVSRVDPIAFAVDGMVPDVVVVPRSEQELAGSLLEARASGLAVIAHGGGSQLAFGNAAKAYDVALSTAGLDQVVAYEPGDLTVTVQAGVRLRDLQFELAAGGQCLPLDPPSGDDATIGGLIATNAFGPARHGYGTLRDWLIGIRVARADGSLAKAGGRVVKNVTGYDMMKLYVGSLGTLGVITEATFKLTPLPVAEATAAAAFDSAAAATRFATAADENGLALHALELLSPGAAHTVLGEARWSVLAQVAGAAAAVQRTTGDLTSLAESEGAELELRERRDVWAAWRRVFTPGPLAFRIGVSPAQVGETTEILDRRFVGAAATLSATVSAGFIRVNLDPVRHIRASTLVEHAREAIERRGGTLIIESAPPALKSQVDVFGPLRPDFAIMKRIKEAFDPTHTLAPGRFLGRL